MGNDRNKTDHDLAKQALVNAIAPFAFWSYELPDSALVSDDDLIEAALLHGDDELKNQLMKVYPKSQIVRVWEQRLVIQGIRLQALNQHLAKNFFGMKNPKDRIQQAYQKYNLYDRFST